MTAQLSRERLEALANLQSLECMALPASHAEVAAMARMLLTGMSSEPVVNLGLLSVQKARPLKLSREMTEADDCDGCQYYRADICHGGKCAAPPAPVATHRMLSIIERHAERLEKDGRAAEGFAEDQRKRYSAAMLRGVSRECRAALQAEPVTAATVPPHIYRELVNQLRDTAVKYQGCQQLREQLSATLRTVITPAAPDQEV